MRTTTRTAPAALLGAAVLALAIAACGSGSSDHADAPEHPSIVDWTAREVQIDDDRWAVEFCEGEAPILCLTDESGNQGKVELSTWDASSYDVIREAWDAGADDAGALRALAQEHAATFIADRAEGCGTDYQVVPDETAVVDVSGRPGVRFGFRGIRNGVTLEHSLGHGVIVDGLLHLISASALADGGCLGPEGEFDIRTFDAATIELLDDIASASVLPESCWTCPPGERGAESGRA